MKQFLVLAAIVALASCKPQYGPSYNNNQQQQQYNPNNNVRILSMENNNNGEQGYNYAFQNDDGTSVQEQGYLKDADSPAAQGSFTFTAPDGQQFSISYSADENGFQPQGAHIPTPPPVPEEILKALEQNSADEARGIVDDGQYRPEPSPQQQFSNQRNTYKY